ncbi:MAG: hypothetical protein ACR2RE_28005 [Geminicoccaceae bacterium]
MIFKDIEDIIEWLEPMDYETFWEETGPYGLVLQPRDHCDQQIGDGLVDEAVVLDVLKSMARMELAQILRLEWRVPEVMPSTMLH